MTSYTLDDTLLGCYVRPRDVSPDYDALNAKEGVVWAVFDTVDHETGEKTTLLRIVRHSRGQIRWSIITDREADLEGRTPPNRATLRSLIRLLAADFAKGRGPLGECHARTVECIRSLMMVAGG